MLQARIGASRIVPIPEEREELLRLGEIRGVSALHVPQSVFRAAASVALAPALCRIRIEWANDYVEYETDPSPWI